MLVTMGGLAGLVHLGAAAGIAAPDADRATATAVVGEAASGGASNAAADDAAERIAPPIAAGADRGAREPRALQVLVRRAFCQKSWHYVGPLVVTAGGVVVAEREVVNQLPLQLVAPAHAPTLVFTAPDLLPAEFAVDAVVPGRSAEIELQPREQLLVEVRRPGAAAAATATWSVAVQMHTGEWGSVDDKGGDSVRVPFAAGEPFRWHARLSYDAVQVSVSGEQPALAPGEQRVLAVDFASVPTQRYLVDGPSPQLLAHCELRQRGGVGGAERSDTVPLAPDGTCELVPFPGSLFSIADVELLATPGGDVVVLRPERELQGVGLVDGGGAPVRSTAFDREGRSFSFNRAVHVAAREVLQQGVRLGSKFLTAQAVPASALAGPADLVLLPAAVDAVTTGALRVRVRGGTPPAPVLGKLHLVVQVTREESVDQPAAPEIVFTLPAGSTCALHWSAPGRTVPIAGPLAVRSGETVDVDVTWPQLAIWTGDVAGFTELPRERRWGRVTWGDGGDSGLFGRGHHVLAGKKDARFELALFDGEALDPTWRLYWGVAPVLARCDIVDAAERRFVVSPAGAVRWVTFAVEAQAPWTLAFATGAVGRPPFPAMRHDNRYALPIAAGQRLPGCLLGGPYDPNGMPTLAWFMVGDGDDQVRIRPAGGRSVELRPRTACANRGAALVGPHGQWSMGHVFEAATPVSVWVPDGTRGVVVFDGNDAARTAREFPLGAGDFVVID